MKKLSIILVLIIILQLFIYNAKASDEGTYSIGIDYRLVNPNSLNSDLENIKSQGFSTIRTSFAWSLIEPSKGIFNFTFYDALVYKARSLGLKIIGILGMGTQDMLPNWVNVDDPNYVQNLKEYAQRVVSRYSDKIYIWQLENELNHVSFYKWVGWRTGNWSMEKINNILFTLNKVVKDYSSSRTMINVIVDNPNWYDFLSSIKNISYDVIGIDYYPNYLDDYSENPGDPNKGIQIYKYLNEAKSFGKEIIVAETGYSTYNQIHSQENQAKFIEQVLIGSIIAGVKEVVIYQYRDRTYGNDIESNFGLLDYQGKEKLAWSAIKKLTSSHIALSVNSYIDDSINSVVFKLNGIEIQTPVNLVLPPLRYNLSFYKMFNYTDSIKSLEKIKIDDKIYNLNFYLIISNDTKVELFYYTEYLIKFSIKLLNNIYNIPYIQIKINSTMYNITNGIIYLRKGHYLIEIPKEIVYYDRLFLTKNKTLVIDLNGPQNLILEVVPASTLKLLILSWFGIEKEAEIEIEGNGYKISTHASKLSLILPNGNYTVKVSSLLQQAQKVNLISDKNLVIYVPEELLLIPIFLFIGIPVFFLLRKRKNIEYSKIRNILDIALSALLYIIVPYYGVLFLSQYLLSIPLSFYDLKGLLLFGIPIIASKTLKFSKRLVLEAEILTGVFTMLYLIFIIGRAFYGTFGVYQIQLIGFAVEVNLAFYIFIVIAYVSLKTFLNFLTKYLK